MMSEADIRDLARRFFDAVERGDLDAVGSIYAPGAVIWHNTDNEEQTVAQNLETLKGFIGYCPKRHYGARRLQVFAGGFVQQHVLTAVRRDGKAFELTACLVVTVENDKITRLDEYLDSAQVTALTAAG